MRRAAGGDELRGQDGLGGQELGDGQVDRGLAVAVFGDAGPGRVEFDVDSSGLLDDLVEVVVNGAVVEGVDDRVAGRPPGSVICRVTASRVLSVRPARKTSPPSTPNFRATAAPMEPPAPNTRARLSFNRGESFITSSSG